jgi:hypothetical protein
MAEVTRITSGSASFRATHKNFKRDPVPIVIFGNAFKGIRFFDSGLKKIFLYAFLFAGAMRTMKDQRKAINIREGKAVFSQEGRKVKKTERLCPEIIRRES